MKLILAYHIFTDNYVSTVCVVRTMNAIHVARLWFVNDICGTIQFSALIVLLTIILTHVFTHVPYANVWIQHYILLSGLSTVGADCWSVSHHSLPFISTLPILRQINQFYIVKHILFQLISKMHRKYSLNTNRNVNNLIMQTIFQTNTGTISLKKTLFSRDARKRIETSLVISNANHCYILTSPWRLTWRISRSSYYQ